MGVRCLVPIAVVALALLSGCAPEVSAETVAARRFLEFQEAIFAKDRKALRRLVCADARAAIPDLCRASIDGRRRLSVTEVTRDRHEYRVHVDDPDIGATFYVLTKEDGRLCVDLLTTMGYLAGRTKATGSAKPTFVPGKLSPGQIEQARAQLAAPPAGR
jgi:hypothetical protein